MNAALRIEDICAALGGLPPEMVRDTLKSADKTIGQLSWIPNPGPQTDAYLSEADELFYGGQAGVVSRIWRLG